MDTKLVEMRKVNLFMRTLLGFLSGLLFGWALFFDNGPNVTWFHIMFYLIMLGFSVYCIITANSFLGEARSLSYSVLKKDIEKLTKENDKLQKQVEHLEYEGKRIM